MPGLERNVVVVSVLNNKESLQLLLPDGGFEHRIKDVHVHGDGIRCYFNFIEVKLLLSVSDPGHIMFAFFFEVECKRKLLALQFKGSPPGSGRNPCFFLAAASHDQEKNSR